jgi:phage shock protein PspC (stress-responsive transcriptional regulator)
LRDDCRVEPGVFRIDAAAALGDPAAMTEQATTYKELRRSGSDRMLAGVCGGLGRYFDVNPVFYRVAFVVLTLLGGAGLLIYGACLLVIPGEDDEDSIAADVLRNHRQRPLALVGLALVAIAGIALLAHLSFHIHSGLFWVAVLIGGALILSAQRRERRVVVEPPIPVTTVETPTSTIVYAPPRKRRNRFLMTLAVLGAFVLAIVVAVGVIAVGYLHLGDGVGNRNYAPTTTAALHDYKLGVGDMKIDLSKVTFTTPTTVKAQVGIGALRVVVPQGVQVKVVAHVIWGNVQALGHVDNGHNVSTVVGSATPQLTVDAHVDAGEIDVTRAVR